MDREAAFPHPHSRAAATTAHQRSLASSYLITCASGGNTDTDPRALTRFPATVTPVMADKYP